jgi:hypothetical protein
VSIAISTALSALQGSLAQFDASAAKIANSVVDGGVSADPLNALIDQLQIKQAFQANAAVIQTSLDMENSSFQLWA